MDLARVRATMRMRLGVVAGIFLVGLYRTNFKTDSGADTITVAHSILSAALPVLGLAAAGSLIVFALAWRETKRPHNLFESKQFRIPTRTKRQ
ncbi:MAG: hypothetical protein EXQ84_01925 [Rhodospirillaceae bacterium]|nr:hypothetical protein [Rhodospirillaceae bacterium]